MKRVASVLIALAFIINAKASDLRIITWNIQDATPHSKATCIAKVAKDEKADVLALQDVNVSPYYLPTDISQALGSNWRYEVTHTPRHSKQLAIFWNTDKVHLKTTKIPNSGIHEEYGIQVDDPKNMPAQLGYFQKGSFDFVLINVNLINAYQDNNDKLKQAALLRDWVKAMKEKWKGIENDFIIAGTFNFGRPGEVILEEPEKNLAYSILKGDGLLKVTTGEICKKDPSAFNYVGDWIENPRLLGGFAYTQGAKHHYVPGSAQVLRVDKNFKHLDDYEANVSSYLPIISRWKTDFED